jgi:hypothetical protein
VSRMARLGEFAPFGRLFTLGRFSKIYIRSNTNFSATVFHSKRYVLIRQIRFGRFFSQTHLVTQSVSQYLGALVSMLHICVYRLI